MIVVDVDTHWESTAPGSNPLAPWNDRLPKGLDRLAFAIAGDLLRALPPERRPDAATLLPGLVRAAEQRGGPVVLHPQHDSSATERVAWMDRVGIDHCLVNPGGYWQGLELLGRDRGAGTARSSSTPWTAGRPVVCHPVIRRGIRCGRRRCVWGWSR
jgi:hypothetical protein